jgi:hypothetical protein
MNGAKASPAVERTYLYAITDAPEGTGVDPSASSGQALAGLDGRSPVSILGRDGVGCIVSAYQGPLLETLSREAMVGLLLAHQRVVERVMRDATVLPVRFGTTLAGRDEVRALLRQNRAALVEALAAVGDKVELDVAATWDMDRVLREIGQDPVVAQAREALLAKGQPSMEERVRVGQLVKAVMDRRREHYRSLMIEQLGPLSLDTASNALVSDELVMNVAFLVARSRQAVFDEAVHRLDRRFAGEITFRVVGPLPAYSFLTVHVDRLAPDQLEDAYRALGLPRACREEAVRQAYRRLAAEVQARPGADQKTTADALGRLRKAAALVARYHRALGAMGNDTPTGVPEEEAAEPLFTVGLRRSEDRDVAAARFSAAQPAPR